MIIIKSPQEIELMRESGKVTGKILRELEDFIKANKTKLSWQSFVAPLIQNKYEKRLPAELNNDEAIELLAILKNKIKEDEL